MAGDGPGLAGEKKKMLDWVLYMAGAIVKNTRMNGCCICVQFQMKFCECFIGWLPHNWLGGGVRKTLDDFVESGRHVICLGFVGSSNN